MAKGKSSASTATRKKHARKAATTLGEPAELPLPKEKRPKGEKKGKKNKEPRKKAYIPPVKPAPVQPDPLDTLGIAQKIPADLLVVLRLLAKKDSVTKRRALEELQVNWVEKARKDDGTVQLDALAEVLPVWFHHVPTLFLHPSRRIRLLAVGLHASLLKLPSPIPRQFFFFLHEVADADQAEYIIGVWCMTTHDVDRQVSTFARESWDRFVSVRPAGTSEAKLRLPINSTAFTSLWDFTQRVLLDPLGVYAYVNPPQPVFISSSKPAGKGASARTRHEDDPPSRSGREDEEESDGDRKARLIIGGFGVAEWMLTAFVRNTEDTKTVDDFVAPLDNLALWSSLYHGQSAPFVQDDMEAFGCNQPGVRKAAWAFAQVFLRTCKSLPPLLVSTLGNAMLRSTWVEPDASVRAVSWQPLLTFLREHPDAWELEAASNVEAADEVDSDDDEDDKAPETPKMTPSESKTLVSHAYEEFRQFLELGCMGSAVQGYPAIIIILSTIPPSIMASVSRPLETLFTSFWAAVDGRALSGLDRTTASAAFLSSLLECTRLLARRLCGGKGTLLIGPEATTSPQQSARELVSEQVKHAWEELCSQRLKVEDTVAAEILAKFLKNLSAADEELFDAAWTTFADAIRLQLHSDTPVPTLISTTLKSCNDTFADIPRLVEASKPLTSEVIRATIERLEQMLEADDSVEIDRAVLGSCVDVLNTFGDELFASTELASAIDSIFLHHVRRLLTVSSAALQMYLSRRGDEEPCTLLWEAVLREMAHSQESLVQMLPPLLDAAEGHQLPDYLRPSSGEMDDITGQLLATALNGHSNTSLVLMKRLLAVPDHFISRECFQGLVSSLGATFSQHVQSIIREEQVHAIPVSGLLSLLELAFEKQAFSLQDSLLLLPDVFTFAFILPLTDAPGKPDPAQWEAARIMWRTGLSQVTAEVKEDVFVHVKQSLRDIVSDCHIPLKPSKVVRMLVDPSLDLAVNVMADIFPHRQQLDEILDALPTSPAESCLAVNDPLVLPGEFDDDDTNSPTATYDFAGYTSYSRIVNSLLSYLLDDRQAAKENVWALRHFLALAVWAQDRLNLQAAQSPVFSRTVSRAELEDVVSKTRRISSYLLAPASQEGWLQQTIRGLQQGHAISTDGIETLLHGLIRPKIDCMRESRILHAILQHVLSDATKEDADDFVQLARSLERKAPHASLAIALSVTRYAPEPPRLERYRNELAAGIFGVPATKANTEGLWLLRQLVATAPDPESDVVFLPVPRAVNLMKACQQWITSDEDLDEAVEAEMTSVFLHLAPILQNVPGSHWDLTFDVMENNLENCSFDDASTLPVLARTLQLMNTIQDLVTTNKTLRAAWDERKIANLTLVRDLVAKPINAASGNLPLSVCRELALTIVQDLPEALLDKDTLSKMCHILTDPSDVVQRMAYKMLRESAAKYTEHLVLEAAVDSEEEVKLELPLELIALLQMNLPEDDAEDGAISQVMFGYLMAWMLTFDLFTNASLRVKSGYLDHLRQTSLISDRFIPWIFGTLRLYDGLAKAVKLDIWAVDEYYLDLYAPDAPHSVPLLAAHLYYRSLRLVPVLIRSWLLDCRDRQLSTTVTSYTSTYFSPALLQAELAQVKDPDAVSQLSDENMKVKVANAVNEITACYTIDEQELEVKLKLPSDWPLHPIEIREGGRVGVTEDRWRAWILGMQQILTFRSGSITDGLVFFMKNVASHFEGQSECAICYSMINAMDGSLPKKPCKTCRNRFHAACLYKWFSSSHSSSCPLCRSEIMQ